MPDHAKPTEVPPHEYQEWRVLSVRLGKITPNERGGGNFQALYVDFEGLEDGWATPDGVYWRRKEGNAPAVGDTFWGNVILGDYGYKFVWDNQKPTSSSGNAPGNGAQGSFSKAAGAPASRSESPDARQASIVRQHSQEMALRLLATAAANDNIAQPIIPSPEWLEMNLSPVIDWFVADANSGAADTGTTPGGDAARGRWQR